MQFAERGDLISTVQDLNDEQLKEERTKAQRSADPRRASARRERPRARPTSGRSTPMPEATVDHDLTGGDPVRFCRVLRSAELSITAWAVAIIQADPSEAGLADLAYAPALVEDRGPYLDAAPQELVARAQPIADRAKAKRWTSLRALGLEDRDIKRLAKAAPNALLGPDSPDGTAVRAKLIKQLEKKVDPAAATPGGHGLPRRPGRPHAAHGPRQRTAGGRRRRRLPLRVGARDRLSLRRRS